MYAVCTILGAICTILGESSYSPRHLLNEMYGKSTIIDYVSLDVEGNYVISAITQYDVITCRTVADVSDVAAVTAVTTVASVITLITRCRNSLMKAWPFDDWCVIRAYVCYTYLSSPEP